LKITIVQGNENYNKVQNMIASKLKEASTTPHKHIIWVDDIRSPPKSIEQNCDVARTYDEAIEMLSKHMYTDIYLDHDIASFDDAGRERTGYDIVLFLVDRKINNEYVPKNFHMLTSNPVGRNNMEAVISRYLTS